MTTLSSRANDRMPGQIKYIVGNEACERFSYYGMRAILTIFMIQYLLMEEHEALSTYHLFVSACYFLPLLGAYVSDRFLGKYKTILYLSIVYCLGHGVLAVFEGSRMGLYAGLALIALGTGGIKPCVSAHVGDQFNRANSHLLQKVYNWFYFSVNFGSFFSSLLIPWILPTFGPGVAFGIPGVLMCLATIVFWMGRKEFVHVPPSPAREGGFLQVLFYAVRNQSQKKSGQSFLDVARNRYPAEDIEGAQSALDIFKVFFGVAAFWALFDQHGSSWVVQARQMDLNFMGMQLLPSQIQALNPIMVMILIPLFQYGLYPGVERLGFRLTPLRKMSAGMVLTGLSFVCVAVIQQFLDAGIQLNVAWQVIPYLIITMSEVMISITGLEFAYTQAPRAMKSTIMSFWLLMVFLGNILTATVAGLNPFSGAMFFWFFATLMFAVSLFFIFMASRYRTRDFMEDGDYENPYLSSEGSEEGLVTA